MAGGGRRREIVRDCVKFAVDMCDGPVTAGSRKPVGDRAARFENRTHVGRVAAKITLQEIGQQKGVDLKMHALVAIAECAL